LRRLGGRLRLAAFAAPLAAAGLSLPAGAAGLCDGSGPRAAVQVPAALAPAVAKAFGIPEDMARDGYVRCAGDRLLACSVGANLNCGKADRRRMLPGATVYCRANPGADFIPMAATGHDTIYEWRCAGRRAVAGKVLVKTDAEGYDAGNWKELP
jgi:hypothetical protein